MEDQLTIPYEQWVKMNELMSKVLPSARPFMNRGWTHGIDQVIEFIKSTGYIVISDGNTCNIFSENGYKTTDGLGSNQFEATFIECYNFVKWYHQNMNL